jgi:hypothetical protein
MGVDQTLGGEFLDDPNANEWVGNVVLSQDGVRRSIPEGAEIEVTIKIDVSRLITVEAFAQSNRDAIRSTHGMNCGAAATVLAST